MNKANTTEKTKQYMTRGSFRITLKNWIGFDLKITYNVKSIISKLSSDDTNVDALFDSHKNGRYKVVPTASGASFTRPVMEPSNSIPNEKLEVPTPLPA